MRAVAVLIFSAFAAAVVGQYQPSFTSTTVQDGTRISDFCSFTAESVEIALEPSTAPGRQEIKFSSLPHLSTVEISDDESEEGQSQHATLQIMLDDSGTPDEDKVCFHGVFIPNDKDGSPVTGEERCIYFDALAAPAFFAPTPLSDADGHNAVVDAFVCEELTLTLRASDNNAGDDVTIYAQEDPGLPYGATVSETHCQDSEGSLVTKSDGMTCNSAERVLKFTPVKGQEGHIYTVCAVAKDNDERCGTGGQFGSRVCIDIAVRTPELQWSEDTPADKDNEKFYVGCTHSITTQVSDANYCVKGSVEGAPDGASYSDCVAPAVETERRRLSVCGAKSTCQRTFSWVPKRGQEGFDYKVCFHGSDDVCGDGEMAKAKERCVNIAVVRCKYCVGEGDQLQYLVKSFHLDTNWLRLWNSNGNEDLDPDTDTISDPDYVLHGEDVINIGPVYRVKAGDSLLALAARFHTTVAKIIGVNPDIAENPGLKVGQKLCVLPCTDTPSEHANMANYAW